MLAASLQRGSGLIRSRSARAKRMRLNGTRFLLLGVAAARSSRAANCVGACFDP